MTSSEGSNAAHSSVPALAVVDPEELTLDFDAVQAACLPAGTLKDVIDRYLSNSPQATDEQDPSSPQGGKDLTATTSPDSIIPAGPFSEPYASSDELPGKSTSVAGNGRSESSNSSMDVDYDELDKSDPELAVGRFFLLSLFCFGTVDEDGRGERALRKMHRVFGEQKVEDCSIRDFLRALNVYVGLERRRRASSPRQDESRNHLGAMESADVEPGPEDVPVEELQLFYHMLRHAESIYGLLLNSVSSPKASMVGLTSAGIVKERAKLSNSDFVVTSFDNSAFCPAHYIALDHFIGSIVVCIRGTANLTDSLTDVAATYDPLRVRKLSHPVEIVDGHGHSGILRSARNVLENTRERLLKTVNEYPNYKVVLTGHSLGGATAAVLSLLLREDERFPPTRAICFGSPPCLSMELADECENHVVTLVNGADIVPRMSIPVLIRYFATCRVIKDQTRWRKFLIDMGLRKFAIKWDRLIQLTDEQVKVRRPALEKSRLYVPGKVFQIVRKAQTGGKRHHVSAGRIASACRVRVIGRSSLHGAPSGLGEMLLSHAPVMYKANLLHTLHAQGAHPFARPREGRIILGSNSSEQSEESGGSLRGASFRRLVSGRLTRRLSRRKSFPSVLEKTNSSDDSEVER